MALRFQSKAAQIALAGTSFAHGLDVRGSTVVPTEWAFNLRGPGAGGAVLYLVSAPTNTAIVVAASGAAATGDVFCAYNHSIIR